MSVSVLVLYFYITNHPKTQWLKTMTSLQVYRLAGYSRLSHTWLIAGPGWARSCVWSVGGLTGEQLV